MNNKQWGDDRIKELVPGIERYEERAKFKDLDSHESQLKNEELYFRMLSK